MVRSSATSSRGEPSDRSAAIIRRGAFDVEDPELLGVAGTRVAVERIPRYRVEGRDPALEVAADASGEAAVVSLSLDREVGHGLPFRRSGQPSGGPRHGVRNSKESRTGAAASGPGARVPSPHSSSSI